MTAKRNAKKINFKALLFGAVMVWSVNTVASEKSENVLETLKYKSGPERENDARAVQTEALIATSEKRAIKQVNKLLKKYRKTAMEPDLWLRLAELYSRRSKTERFFELNRKSETVISLAPQKVRGASSKRYVLKAIGIYNKVIARFPRFEKMDIILFNNAFSNQQLGRTRAAEKHYWKLIKKYTRSPLVADSHLAIGEMAFKNKRFKHALTHFEAIKNYPQSRVYPYGLYKGAWTYYNLRDAKKGLTELEQVVQYGRYISRQGIDARLDLRKEALADMTIFFEDVYPAKKAFSYFKDQAGDLDAAPIILKLSNLYKRHSRHEDLRVLLNTFVSEMKYSNYIPMAHVELIYNFEKMKKRLQAVNQMEKLYAVCDPKSSWVKNQRAGNEEDLDERTKVLKKVAKKMSPVDICQKDLNGVNLKLASKWLKIWKKHNEHNIYADAAEKAFEIYLRRNVKTEKASQNRFAYAELLFQRKKFREASTQYELVGRYTKKKKLSHDSRYAAILSLEKAVKDKWSNSDEKLFQKLAKTYLGNHKKGKYQLDIEYKMALIAYEKSRYDEAGKIFKKLGSVFAHKTKGKKSQDLYLDILNLKKDYVGLKAYSKSLMGKKTPKARMAKLNKIYEESYFLQVQNLESKGNIEEAITGYEKFAASNKKSPLAQKALWNSIQLNFKVGNLLDGASASVAYYKNFPKRKESFDGLVKAAQTYETLGQLKKAAGVLVVLSSADPKSRSKWKSLAADFYFLLKEYRTSEKLYKQVAAQSGPKLSSHALDQLAEIAKTRGSLATYERYLKKIYKSGIQPQASLARLYFVEELYKAKKYSKAFTEAKSVLNMKGETSKEAKSKARLIQAQILDREFQTQSLKTSVNRLALVLELKTAKLGKAQVAYQSTMRYGDPYVAVDAMMKLADAYFKYSTELNNMPLPRNLPKKDAQVFRQEMRNLSLPMEEKGIETLVQALNEAKRLKVYNGSVQSIQAKLDQLNQVPFRNKIDLSEPMISLPAKTTRVGS